MIGYDIRSAPVGELTGEVWQTDPTEDWQARAIFHGREFDLGGGFATLAAAQEEIANWHRQHASRLEMEERNGAPRGGYR
jgi:hypothetical protein